MRQFVKARIISLFKRLLPLLDEAYSQKNLAFIDQIHIGPGFRFGENCSVTGGSNITIGNNFHSGSHLRINVIDEYEGQTFTPSLIIGDNVSVQEFCHIGCIERVKIGSGTMIASRVFITDHNHGCLSDKDLGIAPAERTLSSAPVEIGETVWIGEGACILPGVVLGNNVVVGANAVVTHSFPDNSIVAGVPAKMIRTI